MLITAEILKHMLSEHHNIMPDTLPSNPALCGFRFYDGTAPQMDRLYVIRPEELAFLPAAHRRGIFLCNGAALKDQDLQFSGEAVVLFLQDRVEEPELLNVLSGIFEELGHWEEKLTRLCPSVEGIRLVLNESRRFLRGSILLADNRFHYITYTDDFRGTAALLHTGNSIPQYVLEDILTDPDYQEVQSSHEVTLYQVHTERTVVPALCYNLFKKDSETYGARIMLASPAGFTPDQYDLLKILGDYVADALWQIA
ncbi:MAG: hypothetical protein LIV24_00575, partial [Eubacterium sp.]|nr:hypothetical protein [Eubacterium sp.]